VRTSYYVGPQFDRALEDFITVKKQIPTEMEVIQKESEDQVGDREQILGEGGGEDQAEGMEIWDSDNDSPANIPVLDVYRLQKVIAKVNSNMFMELFEMDRALNRKDYRKGLEHAKQYLEQFVFGVYNGYYKVDYVITNNDLTQFITDMTSLEGFPYTLAQFEELMATCEGISFQAPELDTTLRENYALLQEFYRTMQSYIYSDSLSEAETYPPHDEEGSPPITHKSSSPDKIQEYKDRLLSHLSELGISRWVTSMSEFILSFEPLIRNTEKFANRFRNQIIDYHAATIGTSSSSKDVPERIKELNLPSVLEQKLIRFNKIRNDLTHDLQELKEKEELEMYETYFIFVTYLIDSTFDQAQEPSLNKELGNILQDYFTEPFIQDTELCAIIRKAVVAYFTRMKGES